MNAIDILKAWLPTKRGEYLELISKYAGTALENDAVIVQLGKQVNAAKQLIEQGFRDSNLDAERYQHLRGRFTKPNGKLRVTLNELIPNGNIRYLDMRLDEMVDQDMKECDESN